MSAAKNKAIATAFCEQALNDKSSRGALPWPPSGLLTKPPTTNKKEKAMPTYRMVYGDDEQVVRETYKDVELEHEDGWYVFFRGKEAILRVRDEHVQSLEQLDLPT